MLLGLGRIAALLAGYLALIEVLLLARLPFLERLVGFDRLTIWHRRNGHAVLDLVLAHVVCSVWGYARQDKHSFLREYWNWLTLPQAASAKPGTGALGAVIGGASGGGSTLSGTSSGAISSAIASTQHGGLAGGVVATSPYPGIITATVGTALLIAVVFSSIVIVRRRLSYEWWYAIHFTAYAGIALSWFHMIPAGNELVIDRIAADYWRGLFALALGLVLVYRVALPVLQAARFDLRVTEVIEEAPGVVSLRIGGRGLERLGARAGQFFFWRFLTGGIRSRSPRRRAATRSGSPSRAWATTPRGSEASRSGPGWLPRARSGSSPPSGESGPEPS